MAEPQQLPIEAIRGDFGRAFAAGNVLVEAPTGSGKSTRLPIWCGEQGRVLVIEPRRLACRALAGHVAELMGGEAGGEVGFAVRFEPCYGDETRILFATPGIALNLLAGQGGADSPWRGLAGVTSVMLDEFHERRWDTDLLAALLMRRDDLRLVVTSATVDGARLAGYFQAQRLESGGRLHPVEIAYAGLEGAPSTRDLDEKAAQAVIRAIDEGEAGDILVFLPGKGEIEALYQRLYSKLRVEVVPLHAGSDPQLQRRALRAGDGQKVILATNVAETSLTIPGVRLVIDSGLERRTHHRNGRSVLGLHPISRAAADQRAGRAGRLGPGRALRLWGRRAPLEAHTPPEVLREELTDLMLAAAAAGAAADRLVFPDPLPEHAILRATQRLRGMRAIDENGLLSEHGARIAPLPLDPIFAHLITAMADDASRAVMVDLAAALSAGRPLLRPFHDEAAHRALKEWQPLACDVATVIKVLRETPPAEIPIDPATRKEARRIARHTRIALGLPESLDGPSFDRDKLLERIARAAPELLFVRRAKRREALGNGSDEVTVGRESRFAEDVEAALVLDQHSLPGRGTRQTLSFATCMAPVSLKLLDQLDLGEIELGEIQWSGEQGELRVGMQRHYAGRKVSEIFTQPSGDVARRAIVRLILANRMLKGCGESIREDIAAWNLYLRLGMGEGEVTEPESWLEQRLQQLGVESGEDMLLIEASDLAFFGIPSWERAEFDERHPRKLHLQNLPLAVHYDPGPRKITLERLGGIRKDPPKGWEIPAWSGWKVYFQDASRVIKVR